jgi:H+/Cl- antiporter ClcA
MPALMMWTMGGPGTADSARSLLRASIPALVVGVAAALLLLGLFAIAGWLERVLWDTWPSAMGVSEDSRWWIFVVLTLTGVAVGLVIWRIPGHAGPDPATQSLVSPPLPLKVLPGLTIALVIMLAGGPSLGPENPIMAIGIALAVAAGGRLLPQIGSEVWVGFATAGMIGALFGTPVAAALILSEWFKGSEDEPLWDRIFAPLVAATAGALTVALLEQPTFAVAVPPYPGPAPIDILTAALIALAAAAVGLAGVYAFPHVHRLFHTIGHPLLMVTAGGVVLGLLGALGGRITLFRGVDEMRELTATAADYTIAGLVLIVVVKLAAMVVAATSGFPGGRIFPAVFIGVAIGLVANATFPDIPMALCISAGVLGMVLAVSRDGWISLFIALVVVGEVSLLPVLLLATLPTWLLLTGKPAMLIEPRPSTAEPAAEPGGAADSRPA